MWEGGGTAGVCVGPAGGLSLTEELSITKSDSCCEPLTAGSVSSQTQQEETRVCVCVCV